MSTGVGEVHYGSGVSTIVVAIQRDGDRKLTTVEVNLQSMMIQ